MFNNLFGNSAAKNNPEPPAAGTGNPRTSTSGGNSPGPNQQQGSSDVFIKLALEQMQSAKEARKLSGLKDACKSALETLESNTTLDAQSIQTVFSPFQIACRSRQPTLATIAIDCLGKLFTYNYWGRYDVMLEGDAATGGAVADFDMDTPRKEASGGRSSGDDDRSSSESTGETGGGMVAFVVDTICETFGGGENTDDKLQLQIVKALLAAVSTTDPAAAIHGGVLLKAVRTTYNIFLLSKSANTQIVAQATLTQMVQAVFGRVPKPPKPEEAQPRSRSATPTGGHTREQSMTADAQSEQASDLSPTDGEGAPFEEGVATDVDGAAGRQSRGASMDDERASVASSGMKGSRSIDSMSYDGDHVGVVAALRDLGKGAAVRASQDILNESSKKSKGSTADQYVKDAYLVFRALCKLSMKPIPAPEGATDLKSHAMRSKLLSLHLVHTILTSHMYIFFTPAPVLFSPGTATKADPNAVAFIHAVKQYLCLSLSRNAVSVVPQVFDISLEIFGRVLLGLRTVLKKELSVIFTEIVIPIVEARSSITFHQRTSLLKALQRILSDPQADGGRVLVEIYLNYDCDVEAGARENIWERLINALAKVMTLHVETTNTGTAAGTSQQPQQRGSTITPAITTANMTNLTKEQVRELYSSTGDYAELKKRGLELMVRGVLRPLVAWCNARAPAAGASATGAEDDKARKSEEADATVKLGLVTEDEGKKGPSPQPPRRIEDDPMAFETLKHRKQVLSEGIKRFNFKPKKGMQYLLDSGCISARTPRDIARFLLNTDGLNKSMIGEFLGEGEEENIAIMHAFVDEMDFTGLSFTDALRHFLQCFRLPGEAQKIDRFMLKFAERFVKGNPQSFSSADTAYVLAYSVIMLNTDQHNTQVKKRMTKADFLKNNRGIDNGQDLAPEFLESIFDEINSNEIVMKDEQPLIPGASPGGPNDKSGQNTNRKEVAQFALASETMALKTEAIFNTMLNRKSKRATSTAGSGKASGGFYIASHYEHVKGMFQIIWMSILTGISGPLQESEDVDTIMVALEGFKHATHISCLFDMDLEKRAFLSTLSKFTMLGNIQEMRAKNFEAAKTLLEIAYTEGNSLGESWKDVVLCVSQLERLQLVGNENDGGKPRASTDRLPRRESTQALSKTGFLQEAAAEAGSQSMTLMVDRIFTSSVKLSGSAIVAFVRALCEVSWDEITFSSDREHPRMYCLQRLVEISYYNMKRIRVEWSNIWAILGEHFNQVGCHPNSNVGFFALDKLRQLAMKFLELEELPNFKFQKDFLRPFEHVLGNNSDVKIKDMVLACLQQMIQAKSKSIKSGWKAMFGAFIRAAREAHEPIVLLSFDIVKGIFKNNFESVVINQTFPDAVSCLVEFCKNKKFARTSLQSVEILKQSIPRIYELSKTQQGSKLLSTAASGINVLRSSDNLTESVHQALLASTPVAGTPTACGLTVKTGAGTGTALAPEDDPSFRFWFPILFGLYEVIMTCDLEVRTRALNYLFDTLKQYGASFSRDFWEVISKGVLFPIFDDLRLSRQEHTKFANKEDMSVWLSTTLIQALRQFIDLFGHYFDTLNFQIDGVLELLTVCMTQENETLARIGSTCLQQFIEGNVNKLDEGVWEKICQMFVHLFEVTTPHALFFDPNDSGEPVPEGTETTSSPTIQTPDGALTVETRPRRPRPQKKEFQQIIVKCVLHLLVIQTLQEVLTSGPEDAVYRSLSSHNLFTLIDCLERSYRFAREFNGDMELRMALYRMGFMKQLPNLLKQETSSVSSYLGALIKMYLDTSEERKGMRGEIEKRLVPLSHDILMHYNSLDPESKRRNVNAWRPVVVTIINALVDFDEDQFRRQMPNFYGEVVNLLIQDVTPDVRLVLHSLLIRTGTTFGIMTESEAQSATVSRSSVAGSMEGLHSVPMSPRMSQGARKSLVDDRAIITPGGGVLESAPIESSLPDLSMDDGPEGQVGGTTIEGGWMVGREPSYHEETHSAEKKDDAWTANENGAVAESGPEALQKSTEGGEQQSEKAGTPIEGAKAGESISAPIEGAEVGEGILAEDESLA